MGRFIDLTGERFGRLVVLERAESRGPKGRRKTWWNCKCDCGNEVEVPTARLRNGQTKSCGCLHKDLLREKLTIHGGSKDRLFTVWCDMRRRCEKPYDKNFNHYGGRGITVCAEWHSYENFREWAHLNGYDESAKYGKCTLDRINPNGDYEPGNCRWVSLKVQNNNRRNNRLIEYKGQTKTLKQWAEETGVGKAALESRLDRYGWSVERAIETPVRRV